jgi:hypothetical protein
LQELSEVSRQLGVERLLPCFELCLFFKQLGLFLFEQMVELHNLRLPLFKQLGQLLYLAGVLCPYLGKGGKSSLFDSALIDARVGCHLH